MAPVLNTPNGYSPVLSKDSANIFGQPVSSRGHVQLVVLGVFQVLSELFLYEWIAPK